MVTRRRESGAVSLFLVIFAMILITVVTLSFLRVMIKDQSASSVNDLSQSAYDSALAGTEDAKRQLIYYRTLCNSGDASACATVRTTINSTECNQGLKDVVAVPSGQETLIQQSQSVANADLSLNQAYTCVKMNLDTPDYLGVADANVSKLIPLTTTNNFTSVTVQWFTTEDLGASTKTVNLLSNSAPSKPLYLQTSWPSNRPSLLRAQLIQFGSGFKVSDFDTSNTINSNTNTIFLYPTGNTGSTSTFNDTVDIASRDIRKTATGSPQAIHCVGLLSAGGYACSVTLNIPEAIGQTDSSRTAYLRLTPLYSGTHFRVSFSDPVVDFKGVQPSIDSTGRANTQYRRISTRVDLTNTNFAYPEAAIDVTGNLCKDFLVTDSSADFVDACTP